MAMNKLKAGILRKTAPTPQELAKIKRNPIYLVLDEIIDTYNIGSLFRLADAIGASKMYLCGDMEYPPSSRVHKAAVGTENWVPWEKTGDALETIKKLKSEGVQIVAAEQDSRSIPHKNLVPTFPVAIVVGNETTGIRKDVLDQADIIVELPMYGINNSFNVWGTAAVVAYKVLETLQA